MMMPRRLPTLLLPLLCVSLLLVGCSMKPKQPVLDAAMVRPIGATVQPGTLSTETASAVTLPQAAKEDKAPPRKARHKGHAHVHRGVTYVPSGHRQRGVASWYGKRFHGRRTACGETFNMHGDTAAHRTLPMHTRVLVRNLDNGRSTVVRINDRGPYAHGRIIDLSYAKAKELGFAHKGKARVELVALKPAGKADAARGKKPSKTIQAGAGRRSATIPRLTPAGSKRRAR